MSTPEAIQGLAAEYLVCADLCSLGHVAYLTPANLRYDLVVDVAGQLLRVQVKSTRKALTPDWRKSPTYLFRFKKTGEQGISKTDVDVVALVALDINTIAYLPARKCFGSRMQVNPPSTGFHGRSKTKQNIDQFPFSKLLQELLQ